MSRAATLVIETSTPCASMAVMGTAGILGGRTFSSDRSHNAVLFGPLKELLSMPSARELDQVLVGSGPGSYSGTRVGIAAAQGVAICRGCPAVAVPSVLGLAAVDCWVIGDARRGSFWTAQVQHRQLAAAPTLTDAKGLEVAVQAAVAGGLPVISFEPPPRFPLNGELLAGVIQAFPTAEGLWQAWELAEESIRQGWALAAPQPMYLKPPHITAAKRPWLVR